MTALVQVGWTFAGPIAAWLLIRWVLNNPEAIGYAASSIHAKCGRVYRALKKVSRL